VYVNTHPYSYYANLYGFGIARPLNQEGDFFKLIFHGLNADGTECGKSVEHFFAKFENGQLFQSEKWEWVNLSPLGEIGGVYCTLASTDASNYGPKTPVYFCLDKLQVRKKSTGVASIMKGELLIYPNPTTGKLKIEGSKEIDKGIKPLVVEIYDVYGRNIPSSTCPLVPSSTCPLVHSSTCPLVHSSTMNLNITHLPAGIYFLRIQTEQGMVTKKVIKK
jgi:hypothetical protein